MTSKSAEKQTRVAARRQKRNRPVRSELKTKVTKAEKLIFTGELETAKGAVAEAVAALDGAAEKGIIHGNNAARRKARLVKKLNKALNPPLVEAEAESEPEAEETA